MKSYKLYIDGEWVNSSSGKSFDTENPYNGEVWAKISRGNAEDVDRAVKAASSAFQGDWGQTKPTERGKLLNRLAEVIEKNAEILGEIEVRDNFKSKVIGKNSGQMNLSENIILCCIIRNGEFIFNTSNIILEQNDRLIYLANKKDVKQIEELFE